LVAILRRIAQVSDEERMSVLIVFREASVKSPRVSHVAMRFLQGHIRILAEALTEAKSKGQIRDVAVFSTLPVLAGAIALPQMAREVALTILGRNAEDLFEHSVDILLKGLLPRPEGG
jgi:hypothetical protein